MDRGVMNERQPSHYGPLLVDDSLPLPALLLKPSQTARALSISERTLWSITAPRGPLPAIKVGRRGVRYSLRDVEAWIVAQKAKGGWL
jgi:hypothetical protein